MLPSNIPPHRKPAAGFTLPAILVVVVALLILAVGIRFAVELVIRPDELFTIRETGGA